MPSLSILKSTTRAVLLGTTALVATATGAQAFTQTLSVSQNSTFDLNAGDSLIIDSSGEIVDVSPGVTVAGTSGSITIESGGEITSVNLGIELQGIASDLAGGIIVESTATVTGVTISAGILGAGILVHSGADISGGLDNSGTISGGAIGVLVTDSASLSGASTNSGTIYGADTAIAIGDGATETNTMGALTNTGTIGGNAANDAVAGKGIAVNGSGSNITGLITNSTSGIIVGTAAAIHVTAGGNISGGITNVGMIGQAGTTSGPVTADKGIWVTSSGDISGGIANSGTIMGDTAAILVNSASISGGIVNSGNLLGGSSGEDAAIIVNAGTLGSTTNIGIVNEFGGVISGNGAIGIQGASTIYGITNSGEIFTTGSSAAAIVAISSEFKGDIVNTSTGVIGASISGEDINAVGIAFVDTDSTDGITNSGAIAGTEQGIVIVSSSNLTGAITNNAMATIGSFAGTSTAANATTGILVSQSSSVAGGIINSGSIIGTASGIVVGEDSSVGTAATFALTSPTSSAAAIAGILNNAGGLISGGSTGINIDRSTVLGGISNSGDIEGAIYGINLHNDGAGTGSAIVASLTNESGGEIKSNNTAIFVDAGATISGTLTNAGIIGNVATGGGTAGVRGIHVNGANANIAGGVNNSGTIKGSNAAIEIAESGAISGGITNSSLIGDIANSIDGIHVNDGSVGSATGTGISNTGSGVIAGLNAGILVNNSGSVLGGISNGSSATITGGVYGLLVNSASVAGGVNNAGLIYGASTGLAVTGTTSTIAGVVDNSGTISGGDIAIYVSGANAALSSGILNSGNIIGGSAGEDAAIIVNAGTLGSTENIGIVNELGGIISGNVAIEIQSAATVYGITNSGEIFGTGGSDAAIEANSSEFYGDIVNTSTGVIGASISGEDADAAGIAFFDTDSTDGINNSGAITGTAQGIAIVSNSHLTGAITNNALATIGSFTGTSGSVSATTGIVVSQSSSVASGIINSGSIIGSEMGIFLGEDSSVGTEATFAPASTGSAPAIVGILNNEGGLIAGDNYGIKVDSGSDIYGGIVNAGQILTDTESGTGILVTSASTIGSITNSGIIQGGTDDSGYGIYVSTGSSVTSITNSGTISGDTAAIQFGDSDSTLTLQTGSVLNGNVDGGAGEYDTLILEGHGEENSTFTNFEALIVNADADGIWTLTDETTEIAGAVTVNSGTLLITGNLVAESAVTAEGADLDVEGLLDLGSGTLIVNGIVDGSGTISGAVTINGILSPGNSPGVLSIGGPLVQNTGSIYIVEHDANHVGITQTDRTEVTAGSATIQSGVTVQLDVAPGTDGFADDILTASGGVFGTYDALVINEDNLVALIVYPDANTVAIIAAKTDALAATIGTVSDAGFVFMDNLQEGARRDGRVWATGYIYSAENEGLGNNGADFDQDAFGFNAGVDVISQPNLKVGLAIGYIDGDIDIQSATSDAENDGIFGAAYLNYMNDNFYLDGAIMIGQQTVDTTRTLTTGIATGSVDATSYGANLEAGFELEALGGRLSPFVKVGIHSASLDAYSESGAAGAMTVGDVETQQMRVGAGFRYAVDFGSADGIQVTPAIKLGMTQEWQNGDSSADIGFVGYTGSTKASLDFEDQTTIDLGISFDVKLSQAVTAFVGWNAALGDETTRNTGTIGLSVNW